MKVAEIKLYRMELNKEEFEALRKLVAEGLTVAEEITPVMRQIGEQLGLQIDETPTGRLMAEERG